MAIDARQDPEAAEAADGASTADSDQTGVAIEVRDIEKIFRIPSQRTSRLKERLVNPFARQQYRELHALRDVSFDIQQGEFFGILGRNGSGKSTLLKIMASIYRADGGKIRMAGRLAPFIELGVGFDMELTARENVVLNGVMMGLTPADARSRVGAVIEFAELGEFTELKLKNYSSGMLVRLGFAVMVQADAEILLIDEVLAVGDASFQQKCSDTFYEMRDQGKTIVLVTHDMAAVERYCHRAMLLSEGALVQIGDPGEVARRYLRLNFEERHQHPAEPQGQARGGESDLQLLDIWLESSDGERVSNLEQGEPIHLRAELEARADVPDPEFGFVIVNASDVNVHEFLAAMPTDGGTPPRLEAGQRVTVTLDARNDLLPGHYYVHHGAARHQNRFETAFWAPHVLGFIVYGEERYSGVVRADHEMRVRTQERDPR